MPPPVELTHSIVRQRQRLREDLCCELRQEIPQALLPQLKGCARPILRVANRQRATANSVWRRAGVRRTMVALVFGSMWGWMWLLVQNSENIKCGAVVGDVGSFAWQAVAREPFADLLDSWGHRREIR